MSYPQLDYSFEISPPDDPRIYVLECVRTTATNGWDFGRLFVEIRARGKRTAYRQVPKDGPTYARVTNTRGTIERFEDMRPDPEMP